MLSLLYREKAEGQKQKNQSLGGGWFGWVTAE